MDKAKDTKEKKKKIILTLIMMLVVLLFVLMCIQCNRENEQENKKEEVIASEIRLKEKNKWMILELTHGELNEENEGKTYYGSEEGTKKKETKNVLMETEIIEENKYNCKYTIGLKSEAKNNMYEAYQKIEKDKKTEGQIVIEINEDGIYDFNAIDLFSGLEYKGEMKNVTETNPGQIIARMYIKTEEGIKELANKDIKVGIEVKEFKCEVSEDKPEIGEFYIGGEEGKEEVSEREAKYYLKIDTEDVQYYCVTEETTPEKCEWKRTNGEKEIREEYEFQKMGKEGVLRAYVKDGGGKISESAEARVRLQYEIKLKKDENVEKIYYKINEDEEYKSTSKDMTLLGNYKSKYYYYGEAKEGYRVVKCTKESPCEGEIGKEDIEIKVISEEDKYELKINVGKGIEGVYYKYNDFNVYENTNGEIRLRVKANSEYSYYVETKEGYKESRCTISNPCVGRIEKKDVTITIEGEPKEYKLTIRKDKGIDKIYYKTSENSKYESSSENVETTIRYGEKYYYYGITKEGYKISSCIESSPCMGITKGDATGKIYTTVEEYELELKLGEGINKIYYKIGAQEYKSTSKDKKIKVQYNGIIEMYSEAKENYSYVSYTKNKPLSVRMGIKGYKYNPKGAPDEYTLRIGKDEGIKEIYYKTSSEEKYTKTNEEVKTKVKYNREYSYYGVAKEGYEVLKCTEERPCTGIGAHTIEDTIESEIQAYKLGLKLGEGIERIYYSIDNGEYEETRIEKEIEVEYGKKVKLYAKAKEGYSYVSYSESKPLEVKMGIKGYVYEPKGIINTYEFKIEKDKGIKKIYYKINGKENESENNVKARIKHGEGYSYRVEIKEGYETNSNIEGEGIAASDILIEISTKANEYPLRIRKNEGIEEIHYKIGTKEEIIEDGEVEIQVEVDKEYYYYGVPKEGYEVIECTREHPCRKIKEAREEEYNIEGKIKSYPLKVKKNGEGIERVCVEKEEGDICGEEVRVSIEYNKGYRYYGEAKEGYEINCTKESPCVGVMEVGGKEEEVRGIANKYLLTIEGQNTKEIYYKIGESEWEEYTEPIEVPYNKGYSYYGVPVDNGYTMKENRCSSEVNSCSGVMDSIRGKRETLVAEKNKYVFEVEKDNNVDKVYVKVGEGEYNEYTEPIEVLYKDTVEYYGIPKIGYSIKGSKCNSEENKCSEEIGIGNKKVRIESEINKYKLELVKGEGIKKIYVSVGNRENYNEYSREIEISYNTPYYYYVEIEEGYSHGNISELTAKEEVIGLEDVTIEVEGIANEYNLTFNVLEGINKIKYRIGESGAYSEYSGGTIKVPYKTRYYYYVEPLEGYSYNTCANESTACSLPMGNVDKIIPIKGEANLYTLTITRTNISKAYYKIEGQENYSEYTGPVEVPYNKTYYYYGEPTDAGYTLNTCNSSTNTCSGTMNSILGKTETLNAIANNYGFTLTNTDGNVETMYYRVGASGSFIQYTSSIQVAYKTRVYYYGTPKTGYSMKDSKCTSSTNTCYVDIGIGGNTVNLVTAPNQYTLSISKGTGISQICYKINGASSYTCESNSISKLVNYNSKYYYYGVADTSNCYTLNICNSSTNYCPTTNNTMTTTGASHNISGTPSYSVSGCTAAKYIATISNSIGSNGVITQTHSSTTQTGSNATTDYRYIGANPDNYVCLGNLQSNGQCVDNEHLYRIIGVMPTQTTKSGSYENRIKLIKHTEYLDSDKVSSNFTLSGYGYYWTGQKEEGKGKYTSYTGASANYNNWEESTLNRVVLNQTFYNGLDSKYQNMIGNSVWYLGGNDSTPPVSTMYTSERSEIVYSGNPKYAERKIGLMYPSDYGFATTGGTTTNRTTCLTTNLFSWNGIGVTDCKNNDWLYISSSSQWTITPESNANEDTYRVLDNGNASDFFVYHNPMGVHPTFHLIPSIKISSGTGSINKPYTLTQ